MTNNSLRAMTLLLSALAVSNLTYAETAPSIWQGVYTEAQAARGAEQYSAACASCHAIDLRGNSNSPSLLGMSFMFIWEGRSLAELYTKMRDEMPSDRPGSLSSQAYEDLLAFLLRANQFPVGEHKLVGDAEVLQGIIITAKP